MIVSHEFADWLHSSAWPHTIESHSTAHVQPIYCGINVEIRAVTASQAASHWCYDADDVDSTLVWRGGCGGAGRSEKPCGAS